MGTVISKAAGGIGTLLGNTFVAPFKTIFGRSCEGICLGTWDIVCFIENLCVSDLVKLLLVLILTYITLLFVYLLFKVGIIQCIGRSCCKMACAACEAYWTALEEISCFLWHKLRNTKRVYRHRFEDMEGGFSSSSSDYSDSDSSEDYGNPRVIRRRRPARVRRRDNRFGLKGRRSTSGRHHHVRLKTREVSVHLRGGSGRMRNSRQLQLRNMAHHSGHGLFKRRRIR